MKLDLDAICVNVSKINSRDSAGTGGKRLIGRGVAGALAGVAVPIDGPDRLSPLRESSLVLIDMAGDAGRDGPACGKLRLMGADCWVEADSLSVT